MNSNSPNSLATLLSELSYQSSSKVSPISRAEGVTRITSWTGAGKRTKDFSGSGDLPGHTTHAEASQTTEQHLIQPAFIPLPLRSGLFKEARFFAKANWGKEGSTAGGKEVSEIFICLVTENLGRVWIGLSSKKDFLSVKYFTDKEASSKTLKENFSPLREGLKEIGFTEVSLNSQVRAELGKVVEGLLPRFEEHLLDRKI